jgi:hypothetical protein
MPCLFNKFFPPSLNAINPINFHPLPQLSLVISDSLSLGRRNDFRRGLPQRKCLCQMSQMDLPYIKHLPLTRQMCRISSNMRLIRRPRQSHFLPSTQEHMREGEGVQFDLEGYIFQREVGYL